ncbi:hypothetical protein BDZ89DRAFT_470289 [Hymenopellis radicata]|nr:hypothetical protein BDZ89DRAFT_470289 [Hymenopellis radicata]
MYLPRVKAPTESTQWQNEAYNLLEWDKGVADGIQYFDIELTRLGSNGLLYGAVNGTTFPNYTFILRCSPIDSLKTSPPVTTTSWSSSTRRTALSMHCPRDSLSLMPRMPQPRRPHLQRQPHHSPPSPCLAVQIRLATWLRSSRRKLRLCCSALGGGMYWPLSGSWWDFRLELSQF